MDVVNNFLIDWGYWGMLLAAFLAGSFIPFSSEAVMLGLMAAGLDPWGLVVYGSIGNILGSMFNYGFGRLGKMEWIERYLHIKREKIEKTQQFLAGRGAWTGFFAFLPILGSAVMITLGLMRANVFISFLSCSIGKILRYIILIVGVNALFSCTRPSTSTATEELKTITVTIEPLRWFTEQLCGDRYKVLTMVPAGSSPETYEPTPRQLVDLSHTLLYIEVGQIGFERSWMPRLRENAPKMTVVDSSRGIAYIHSAGGALDPHTWMSCRNARLIARNIYEALLAKGAKSHGDSVFYRQHYDRLLSRIHTVDTTIRRRPFRQRAFVIYHPILTYYAHDNGLVQLPMEEEGREPSTRQMEGLIRRAKQIHVKTVFIQREFSPRNAMEVVEATHAEPVSINPLSYDWDEEMIKISNLLQK